MAEIKISENTLTITPSLTEKLMSIKFQKITIPVESIDYIELNKMPEIKIRTLGFSCCGYKYGVFLGESGKKIYILIKGRKPTITIHLKSYEYDMIVIDSSVKGWKNLVKYAKLNGLLVE